MSVKIYDGMIAVDKDPFVAAQNIRKVIEPIFFEKFKVIYDAYKELESGSKWNDLPRYFDNDELLPKIGLDVYIHRKMAELDRSAQWTFSDADIFYNVTLVPNSIPDGNPLLMLFSDKSNDYVPALIKSGVVQEFGYWDNSEEPEGVTEEEWVERKNSWGALVEDDLTPAQAGLCFSSPSSMDTSLRLLHNIG